MLVIYFYTPVFTSEGGDSMPGTGSDPIVCADPIPAGMRCHHDATVPRYAIEVQATEPAQADWTLKTRSEVNADYPGIFGGV